MGKLALQQGQAPLRGLGAVRLSVMKDETTSPARQRQSILAKAAELGVEVDESRWAYDLNVSASAVEPFSRPELGDWLTNKMHDWDVIFFWKQDRAARSIQDMSALLAFAQTNKKVLVICEEPGAKVYDYREGVLDVTEALISQMGALFFSFAAALEVENIRLRVKSSHQYLRSKGEWGGGRFPFGYEPVKESGQRGYKLLRHEPTFQIVREIVTRLIDGDAQLTIAEDLNARGVPTPFDYWDQARNPEKAAKRKPRAWNTTAIGKMMRSRALLGESVYEGRAVTNDAGEPVERSSDPIVSAEEWDLLQAALTGRSLAKIRYADANETLQVARCGSCGAPLYTKESVAKGRTYSHLVCRNRQKQYGGLCTQPGLPKRAVEEILRTTVLASIGGEPVMRRKYVLGDNNAEELAKVVRLRKSLQKEQRLGLIDAEDEQEYFEQLELYKAQERQLRTRPIRKAGYEWEPTGQTFSEVWDDLKPRDRRRLLLDLGIKMYVGLPDHFEGGDQAWSEFAQSPEDQKLPSASWFGGVQFTAVEVERTLGDLNGQVYLDGMSSGSRTSAIPTRSYKTRPFRMCLVRSGSRSLSEAIQTHVLKLTP